MNIYAHYTGGVPSSFDYIPLVDPTALSRSPSVQWSSPCRTPRAKPKSPQRTRTNGLKAHGCVCFVNQEEAG